MAEYVLRNIAGFLVQIVPNAALCFIPFMGSLRMGARRLVALITGIIAVALIPFTIVGSVDMPGLTVSTRFLIQNIIFFLALAVLFALYTRAVEASTAQKVFVFFVVMCYGNLVTQTEEKVVSLFDIPTRMDGHMYNLGMLSVLTLMSAVLYVPMSGLMRFIRQLFSAALDDRTWWQFAVLPIAIVAAMFLGGQLVVVATQDADTAYYVLTLAFAAFAVFVMWWMLRLAYQTNKSARQRARLEAALERHQRAARELKAELKAERLQREQLQTQQKAAEKRAATLAAEKGATAGEKNAPAAPGSDAPASAAGATSSAGSAGSATAPAAPTDADAALLAQDRDPVVLSTTRQAVSFSPQDVLYVESLNRTRFIHLADGETIQINMTLANVVETLPRDQFMYCHRSIAVNLDRVSAVNLDELVMEDGSRVPISRRRRADLIKALSDRNVLG